MTTKLSLQPSMAHVTTSPIYASCILMRMSIFPMSGDKKCYKANKLTVVGYTKGIKGYRLLDPVSHRLTYHKNVIFHEQPVCGRVFGDQSRNQFTENDESSTWLLEQSKVQVQTDQTNSQPNPLVSEEMNEPVNQSDDSQGQHLPDSENEIDNKPNELVAPSLKQSVNTESQEYQPRRYTRHYTSSPMEWSQVPLSWESYIKISASMISGFASHVSSAKQLEMQHALMAAQDIGEPANYRQAMSSLEASEWRKAAIEEYQLIMENGTWELTDLPKGRKALTGKWVFRKKLNPDRSVSRFKARYVVHGCKQVEGIDFNKTFSPVVCSTSIRMLLALVAEKGLLVHHMDVKTAFLNGYLEEEIYIQ